MSGKIYKTSRPENIPCPHCGHTAFKRENPEMYRCGYCGRLSWIKDLRSDAEKLRDAKQRFNRIKNRPISGTRTRTRSTGSRWKAISGTYVDGAGRTHYLKDGERIVYGEHGSRYIEDSRGLKTLGGSYFWLR